MKGCVYIVATVELFFHIISINCEKRLLDKEFEQLWKEEQPLWLEEYERGVNLTQHLQSLHNQLMLADDPKVGGQLTKLPPKNQRLQCPSTILPSKGLRECLAPQCDMNEDCPEWEMCCSNGCVSTCRNGEPLPSLVDWENQPHKLSPGSNSWLLAEPSQDFLDAVLSRGDISSLQGCVFQNSVIPEGTQFEYENHPCHCFGGEINCNVKPADVTL